MRTQSSQRIEFNPPLPFVIKAGVVDNLVEMYWLDLAIIYFAFGAPFGVLRITAKREITPFAFFRMTSGYLLWPLVAVRNVARFFTTKPVAQVEQTNELDAIRTELEQALFASGNTFSESAATRRDLYTFREVFYRYSGLAAAANGLNSPFTIHNSPISNSPFTIHHSSFVRSTCLRRRDRQKLEAQLTQARSELIDTLMSDKLLPALDQLATKLNDNALLESSR